jgi:hypothetical protein
MLFFPAPHIPIILAGRLTDSKKYQHFEMALSEMRMSKSLIK